MSARFWQCDNCHEVTADADLLRAPSPFDPEAEVCGCPACRQIPEFRAMCDEPGCTLPCSGGWPGPGSEYRFTCADHRRRDAEATNA